jgi:GNAT superfamily N-acetyltransferase
MSKFLLTSTNRDIAAQIGALLNLGGQLLYGQTEWSILQNPITYVIEMSGEQVAGVIGIEVKNSNVSELKHLCVHPDHRRKGLGLKLLIKGTEYATTPFVYGAVRSDNATNIRNNFRAGFRPVAKHRGRGCEIIIFAGRRDNVRHGIHTRGAQGS